MIKKIHYCWFGGNPKNSQILDCISSWRKFFPDWEIIEWNETNFDIKNSCKYVQKAYKKKKWAFVSDYVRFWVLNKYGGLYLDTDVLVLKYFFDSINPPFLAIEYPGVINSGLSMYLNPGDSLSEFVLSYYHNIDFSFSIFKHTIITEEIVSDYFKNKGFSNNDVYQKIQEYNIYPTKFFRYQNMDSVAIHLQLGSWIDKKTAFRFKLSQWVYRIRNNKK